MSDLRRYLQSPQIRARLATGEPIDRAPLRIRLTLDDGLAAYIRAIVASPIGFYGDERATIIFMVRQQIIQHTESPVIRDAIMPWLPVDIRRAWGRER